MNWHPGAQCSNAAWARWRAFKTGQLRRMEFRIWLAEVAGDPDLPRLRHRLECLRSLR